MFLDGCSFKLFRTVRRKQQKYFGFGWRKGLSGDGDLFEYSQDPTAAQIRELAWLGDCLDPSSETNSDVRALPQCRFGAPPIVRNTRTPHAADLLPGAFPGCPVSWTYLLCLGEWSSGTGRIDGTGPKADSQNILNHDCKVITWLVQMMMVCVADDDGVWCR